MRWHLIPKTVAAASLLIAGVASAEPDLSGLVMYGVNRDSGNLARYDFSQSRYENVGPITVGATNATGIDGAAYIPGFQNIFAFWNHPDDELTRLLYVDSESAQASVVGADLGKGHVTGAVAALISGSPQWLSPSSNSLPLAGTVGINPNNSPDNEFVLVTDSGTTITRDDLHQNSPVGADGTYYMGGATNIRIRPKGSGTQDGMSLGGQPYPMHNNVTYLFTGDFNVKVYNDHVHSNGKAMGKWYLEVIDGEAAIQDGSEEDVASDGEQWLVFALQNVETTEDEEVEFDIEGDNVTPSESFRVKVSVLGAAISAGGAYDVPVSVRVRVGGSSHDLWGDYNKALDGNVNDENNPRDYIFPQEYPAGTSVSMLGRSWLKKNSNHKGHKEHHWKTYMSVDGSASDSQQLIVLRDGDDAPQIEGFLDQGNVVDFIRDYIDPDTNKVVLDENQAIFLYELGTTNMNSDAADFQDLVALVTLAKTQEALEEDDDDDEDSNAPSRLLKVNHKTGGYEQIMTLDRVYDSLAWKTGHEFYAMTGNELWRIDPEAQTETLVDPVSRSGYFGLEFAGQWLMGFDVDSDTLAHIDEQIGADDDLNLMSLNMQNLGSIIFMPIDDDPALQPDAFD